MNGCCRIIAFAILLGAGSLASAGWLQEKYYQCVDPCWPQRYSYLAAQAVNAACAAQVFNGHVLDQTVWNYMFEPGTDRLTAIGMYHLNILARRRPHPDGRIFLQTAQDIEYNPANPEAFVKRRAELDAHRVQAVLRYLQAQTAARPVNWDVTVHDPGEVGLSAVPVATAITQRDANFRGVLPIVPGAMGAGAATGAVSGGTIGGGMGTTMGLRTGY